MPTIKIRDIVCEPGQKVTGFIDVAETPSSMVKLPIMIVNGTQPGPTICLVGGTHATEYVGVVTVINTLKGLDPSRLTGAVIGVPVHNVPGFEVIEAFNPIDGLQLQEACPGLPNGTMSHRIAHALFEEIIKHADYVIDYHGGGRATEKTENTILRVIGDEKIDKISEGMARYFLLEYISLRNIRKTGQGVVDGGILRGKPGLIIEVGGEGKVPAQQLEDNVKRTLNVLRYLKILKGEPISPPPQKIMRQIVRMTCNRGGIFISQKRAPDPIRKGEVLGEIMDLFGNVREQILSPFDGVIYAIYPLLPINAGDMTYMVASFEGDLFYTGGGYAGYREICYRVVPPGRSE